MLLNTKEGKGFDLKHQTKQKNFKNTRRELYEVNCCHINK